jgi:predicted nucleic acid-binding Zn ribbon protein
MFCKSCGAWNPDESRFCGKCGKRLEDTRQAQRRFAVTATMAGVLVVLAILCVGAFAMRDRLAQAWQVLVGQPTEVAVPPTASPTQVPIAATATPTLTSAPSPSPTVTEVPTPMLSATPTETATPRSREFKLLYRECIPHGFALGSVKGQVFDKSGQVIPSAKVRITINGYAWESEANPATTNSAGWYEWTLEVGQKVQFVELIVGGEPVPFSPRGFEVEATGGCFQRVDFVEQ